MITPQEVESIFVGEDGKIVVFEGVSPATKAAAIFTKERGMIFADALNQILGFIAKGELVSYWMLGLGGNRILVTPARHKTLP